MRPIFKLLNDELVDRIIDEGFELLTDPGIEVHNAEARKLLSQAGADVDHGGQVARIPRELAQWALEKAPSAFDLYDVDGQAAVHYGGDKIQFDPGSAAITILDRKTGQQRVPDTRDFVDFVKLVETLPQIDAQSTALIPGDVVEEIGDLYRLYLALNFMRKPVVTGAFRKDTFWVMKEMLALVAGGEQALAGKPIAIFDVCPSPPLKWSDLTCQNLIDCARSGIPSEMVSMPLAGATAPVTLAGAIVQHTAECLSGVVICQLASEGAPIVWGGSPSVFDMRSGTTPMGAVGTWMIDCGYVQIGKALNMPTHAYLGMTDAKVVDAQAGLESAGGAILAALAGVNMISGAGMMDFESCQSYEKLVLDAEIIGMAKRLVGGVEARDDSLAVELMRSVGHGGDFLREPHTRKWFREEFYIPSAVIDRGSQEAWREGGSTSAWDRAGARVDALLADYQPNRLSGELKDELRSIAAKAAQSFGMNELPPLP
ncbi:MAG: trimethylamine methyltransferase family protein [Anaerolineales bacterium]|jgi:trimethylamine--corrinoid protein Co-methyltransferase